MLEETGSFSFILLMKNSTHFQLQNYILVASCFRPERWSCAISTRRNRSVEICLPKITNCLALCRLRVKGLLTESRASTRESTATFASINNVYITVALSPGGIISGWYSVVLTALYH